MYLQNCRVCLKKCVRNQILLSDILGDNTSALDVYNQCTQLDAYVGDNLPQILCQNCGKELNKIYKFVCKAKETQKRLRSSNELFENKDELEIPHYVQNSFLKVDESNLLRDPLEESADESNDSKNYRRNDFADPVELICNDYPSNHSTDGDEEDNITLKTLMENELESHSNNECKTEAKLQDNDTQKYVDSELDEFEYENHYSDIAAEFSKSVQSQIFPQGQYKCKSCDKRYFTEIGLKAHIEYHIPKSSKSNATSAQRKRNKTKKVLEVNSSFDASADAVKVSNTLQDENNEITTQKNKPKEKLQKSKKLFPCNICGKIMISASKLRYHMVMHTGEKNYLCTVCPKAYSTIYALKHHIRTHTGERPYECKFCGERFLRPTTLKSHLRRHTGERPYGCNICGKRFIQHSSMTTHVRLNHMEKTIPCPHCHKKYARKTDLNTHLLSHTGDKPFSCHLCQRRFIRQANLNKHMNQLHMDKSNLFKNSKKSNNKYISEQKVSNQALPNNDMDTNYTAPVAIKYNNIRNDNDNPSNYRSGLVTPPIGITIQTKMDNNNLQQTCNSVSTNTDRNMLTLNKTNSLGLVPL
ncbi:zinc finger protein 569-like isoform X2 [Teleopsis dalmanni]|uniref:zinc finger protein 569-like isoform X2 n=1 Tax=Teleopsis dalmanni TaxID=139649 RepID=UPI0018CCA2D6|nr:zinc finger protein 569-like isoform X2 [Teleopsis dalmanni]